MKTQIEVRVHQDQKYLDALVENDAKLIEEIYQKCSSNIKRMIVRNNGSIADAQDIFQESIISVYKKAKEGYILSCPIENFIYMVSKRKWLNKLRRKNFDYKGDFIDVLKFVKLESSEVHDLELNTEERTKLVMEKFRQLSPSCKEIISLSWNKNIDGKYLSWKEIANDLDLSYGYVRKKAAECKARLIKLVKNDPNFLRLK